MATCAEEALPSVKGVTNRAQASEDPLWGFQGGRMEGKGGDNSVQCLVQCLRPI